MSQNSFSHPIESSSSVHDEVYLAMRRFLKTLRLFGLFPIKETIENKGTGSIVNGLKFRFLSKYLFLSSLALLGTMIYWYGVLWYHINLIPNPIERAMMTTVASLLSLGAAVHLISTAFLARHWPAYFKNWQIIDQLLDIKSDKKLANFVAITHSVFISYAVSSMAMSLYSIVLNFIYEYDESTSYPIHFGIAVFCYAVYVPTCQILPEILFTCLCRAIHIRLQKLTENVQNFSSRAMTTQSPLDVSGEVEVMRLAYQKIMSNIKYTNHIMDLALLLSCLINAGTLSSVIYLVMKQTVDNFGVIGLKLLLAAMNLIRLVPVCLSAEKIKVEMRLFMRFVGRAPENPITALGLIHVNKGYINSVAGAIVTYTLTLFQFDEQVMGSAEEELACGTNVGISEFNLKNDTIYI